jgi:hypothetical protein
LVAQNNFYEFLNLQGFSEKRNQSSEKKEIGPGVSDLSQAGPDPTAC